MSAGSFNAVVGGGPGTGQPTTFYLNDMTRANEALLNRQSPFPTVVQNGEGRFLIKLEESTSMKMLEMYCALDKGGQFKHALISIAGQFLKLPHVVYQDVVSTANLHRIHVPNRSEELALTPLILYVLRNPGGDLPIEPAAPGQGAIFRPDFPVPVQRTGCPFVDSEAAPHENDGRAKPSFLFSQALGPTLSGISPANYNQAIMNYRSLFSFGRRKTGGRLARFSTNGRNMFEYNSLLPGTSGYQEAIETAGTEDPQSFFQKSNNEPAPLEEYVPEAHTLIGLWRTTTVFDILNKLPTHWKGGVEQVTVKVLQTIFDNRDNFDLFINKGGRWAVDCPYAPSFRTGDAKNAKETRFLWWREHGNEKKGKNNQSNSSHTQKPAPPPAVVPAFTEQDFPSLGGGIKT